MLPIMVRRDDFGQLTSLSVSLVSIIVM
uniref:Uncharacterized protein n=1 Tax=Rhizophora mucronata TaxID=61149 RepID=A0A2P2NII2_RHIMU